MANRLEAAAIVRALARGPEPLTEGPSGDLSCALCHGEEHPKPFTHEATCPYRLAREWDAASSGDADMGALPWNKGQPAILWTPTPGAPEIGADWWVTVCSACLTAICWHGEMYCDHAKNAGTAEKRASTLRALNREHPDNFSPEKIWRVTGNPPKAVTTL